jgi:MerR family transcriptional regulator, copper efflux regulator
LSKKSGFSRDTIRFYEKKGLIEPGSKLNRENNYKDYPEKVLKRLLAIRKIKGYGFTLEETKNIFILFEEGLLEMNRGKRYIQRKICLLDKKINELLSIKKGLQEIAGEKWGNCAIHNILIEMS